MAREESSREDFMREATALVERIELIPQRSNSSKNADSLGEPHIVAGFRADGSLSIFFGDDPVYQFNAAAELRRAYCDGLLFKAVRGRLASLERVRNANDVQLVRHDLSDDEQASFLSLMNDRLNDFAQRLASGQFATLGQVPPDANVLKHIREWFAARGATAIAQSPNVAATKTNK